jgi:hypothetical protein
MTDQDRIEQLEAALHRLVEWSEAYPLSVFPAPAGNYLQRAQEALAREGLMLDRITADTIRHVVERVGKIAKDALQR